MTTRAYTHLETAVTDGVLEVTINRPDVRNAFDGTTLSELTELFGGLRCDSGARAAFLSGAGGVFSAGADLKWMRSAGDDPDAFKASSRLIADAMLAIHRAPVPTVALVEKAAVGGALGLVAACDFAVCGEGARLGTTEVRLGIAPAVISPFLYRKMGDRACRRMFLSGERLSASQALDLGLVDRLAPDGETGSAGRALIEPVLAGGPRALAECKALLDDLSNLDLEVQLDRAVERIARLRAGTEGQEGMTAFLEKRKPDWMT